jgi:glycine cleavage system H lipoate-binding protein
VLIPLDSKELDAEARTYLAKVEESMTPEQKAQVTQFPQNKALENIRQLVYQNRVGHFQLECRVSDGSRVMGTNSVKFEVLFKLFKGRFSDVGLPGSPLFRMDVVESQKMTESLRVPICGVLVEVAGPIPRRISLVRNRCYTATESHWYDSGYIVTRER